MKVTSQHGHTHTPSRSQRGMCSRCSSSRSTFQKRGLSEPSTGGHRKSAQLATTSPLMREKSDWKKTAAFVCRTTAPLGFADVLMACRLELMASVGFGRKERREVKRERERERESVCVCVCVRDEMERAWGRLPYVSVANTCVVSFCCCRFTHTHTHTHTHSLTHSHSHTLSLFLSVHARGSGFARSLSKGRMFSRNLM